MHLKYRKSFSVAGALLPGFPHQGFALDPQAATLTPPSIWMLPAH